MCPKFCTNTVLKSYHKLKVTLPQIFQILCFVDHIAKHYLPLIIQTTDSLTKIVFLETLVIIFAINGQPGAQT